MPNAIPENGPIEPSYTYRNPPRPLFLAPKTIEQSHIIEIPPARSLVDWSFDPVGNGPLILIWGRADYEDVFGQKHFVEWCHQLRLDRHDGKKRSSHFLRQPVKVDSPIQRTNHHEDAETVFG